jgi:hypothetical protein
MIQKLEYINKGRGGYVVYKDEQTEIKIFPELPVDWKHYLNFRKAPVELLEQVCFCDVEEPEFDPNLQQLRNLIFDASKKVFIYLVLDKVIPSLDEAKILKINELKKTVKVLYASVQWLVEAYRIEEIPLPANIGDKIRLIKSRYEQAKNQVNALITVPEVLKWQVPYEAINILKNELEQLG